MQTELTEKELAIIAKVEKLLALSKNNDNEHQAAAASAKAMELLAAYNLDMALVGSSKGASRQDSRLKGGLYQWQRDLWNAVCKLNFCLYRYYKGTAKGSTYEHRVIGSHVNVTSVRIMAEYLQQAVERLAQEWARGRGYKSVFVREAIAYREGMADRLTDRLWELRQERLRKDQETKKSSSDNAGTALVLADVIQAELDLNIDALWGYEPGTTAKERSDRLARQLAAEIAAQEELRKRDEAEAADPILREIRLQREEDERLAKEAEDREYEKREARNAKRRKGTYRERRMNDREMRRYSSEFRAGYERGADIGLDAQVDHRNTKRL